MNWCPQCRQPVQTGHKFCPACGAPVRKHRSRTFALGLAILFAVVILVLVLASNQDVTNSQTPAATPAQPAANIPAANTSPNDSNSTYVGDLTVTDNGAIVCPSPEGYATYTRAMLKWADANVVHNPSTSTMSPEELKELALLGARESAPQAGCRYFLPDSSFDGLGLTNGPGMLSDEGLGPEETYVIVSLWMPNGTQLKGVTLPTSVTEAAEPAQPTPDNSTAEPAQPTPDNSTAGPAQSEAQQSAPPEATQPTAAATAANTSPVNVSNGDFAALSPWYVQMITRAVQQYWYTQDIAAGTPYGSQAVVDFTIHRDGTVSDIRIAQASSSPTLNASALQAVELVGTFQPLPSQYTGRTASVEYTFTYSAPPSAAQPTSGNSTAEPAQSATTQPSISAGGPSTAAAATASDGSLPLISGTFTGVVQNQSAHLSAVFGIQVQQTAGTLTGCMTVKPPLAGSGTLAGSVEGNSVSFTVTSAVGRITFTGHSSPQGTISGTYIVQHPSASQEYGLFILRREDSESASVGCQP